MIYVNIHSTIITLGIIKYFHTKNYTLNIQKLFILVQELNKIYVYSYISETLIM